MTIAAGTSLGTYEIVTMVDSGGLSPDRFYKGSLLSSQRIALSSTIGGKRRD
jgi:hypothetical protein